MKLAVDMIFTMNRPGVINYIVASTYICDKTRSQCDVCDNCPRIAHTILCISNGTMYRGICDRNIAQYYPYVK